MTVSMLALLRLFLWSIAFGALLAVAWILVRFFLRLSFLPTACLQRDGEGRGLLLPSRSGGRGYFFLCQVGECVGAILVALSFSVFLFWQAEGIPRLFVFLAAALGAAAPVFLYRRYFAPLEGRFLFRLRSLLLFLCLPPLRILLRLVRRILRGVRKILLGIIKILHVNYTMVVSHGYMKRAPRRLSGRRMRLALRASLGTGEGR